MRDRSGGDGAPIHARLRLCRFAIQVVLSIGFVCHAVLPADGVVCDRCEITLNDGKTRTHQQAQPSRPGNAEKH